MSADLDQRDWQGLWGPDSPAENEAEYGTEYDGFAHDLGSSDFDPDAPVRPINWNLLSADEALAEWMDLDAWVGWLRTTFGLSPAVVPPLWHRHDELVWELSALHTHWLSAYDPDSSPSSPIAWHRDFAEARHRLREWVSTAGCRLDRDRPTRQTTWPGEATAETSTEGEITDRRGDFLRFVNDDIAARRLVEERARALSSPHHSPPLQGPSTGNGSRAEPHDL
jgi:hypothetical protein